ncbi:hypothetical protein [Sphingomonas sp. ID0503]|uniref:hypothetical protein n=1 Tax=Sphingomonas sp. ID0503 TaxID=3399691 RepID=UPI003AFAC2A5
MQPSFDLRLRSVEKALTETILPAIDPAQSAAVEQLHLVIGSLRVLRDQSDYAHWFEVVEAREMGALARELIDRLPADADEVGGARDVIRAADECAARFDRPLSALREANRALRDALAALIRAALADPSANGKLRAQILAHSERQIARERAFVAATGFDCYPDTLRGIEEALR